MDEEERTTEVRETSSSVNGGGATQRTTVTRSSVSGGIVGQRIIYLIAGVVVAFLILRIILLLLAANQGNTVVDFIYGVSGIFVAPFYGIFNYTPTYGASMLDISSIAAIVIYLLIAWGLASIVTLGSRRRDV